VEHEGVVPLGRHRLATDEEAGFVAPPAGPRQSSADRAFVGTLTAIVAILASRFILLLATTGAFVLAMKSDGNPGWWVLVAYACLTVLPLTVLDVITRQRSDRT
jgi:hypothetical protein